MSTTISPVATKNRPTSVTVAVMLTVLGALTTIPFFFLPGNEDIPEAALAFGAGAALLSLVGAWGLWNLRKWGAIVTFVVTLLNTISALPALGDPPSGWIVAGVLLMTPVGIAVLVLIALPSSRRAYR